MLERIYEYATRTPEVIALQGQSVTISYQALPLEVQRVVVWLSAHLDGACLALAMPRSSVV